jgi:hypothetical protein
LTAEETPGLKKARKAGVATALFAVALIISWVISKALGLKDANNLLALLFALALLYFATSAYKGHRRFMGWSMGFSIFYFLVFLSVIGFVARMLLRNPTAVRTVAWMLAGHALLFLLWSFFNVIWLYEAFRATRKAAPADADPGPLPTPLPVAAPVDEAVSEVSIPSADEASAPLPAETAPVPAPRPSASLAVQAGAMVFLVLAGALCYLTGRLETRNTSELIGRTIAPTLLVLIVVALFSIFKRFRTRAAMHNVAFCTALIFFVLSLLTFVSDTQKEWTREPVAQEAPDAQAVVEFAHRLEQTVSAGDPAFLRERLDIDLLFDRMFADRGISAAIVRKLRSGFERNAPFADGVVKQLHDSGFDYAFLRLHTVEGQRRAIFRLSGEMGLNYHDVLLVRKDGLVKIEDIYVVAAGEFLSDTMRRVVLPIIAAEGKDAAAKMTKAEKEYVDALPQLDILWSASRAGDPAAALAAYRRLPVSVQNDKSLMIMRLGMSMRLGADSEEYQETIKKMAELFPDDPSMSLALIDYHLAVGEFDKAHACVQRVRERVGGDEFLDQVDENIDVLANQAAAQEAREP